LATRISGSALTPLGHHEERFWPADPAAPAWGRRRGAFKVFIPDTISAREFTFDGEALAAVAEASRALTQLQDAGILKKLNKRKWGRVWECDELLTLLDDFERSLSVP
jgi:hypothetical protein